MNFKKKTSLFVLCYRFYFIQKYKINGGKIINKTQFNYMRINNVQFKLCDKKKKLI